MVRMELGNGKTVMLTLEQYLDLTDEDIQNLIADDKGVFINDPFKDRYAPLYLKKEDDPPIDDDIPPDEIDKIFNDND